VADGGSRTLRINIIGDARRVQGATQEASDSLGKLGVAAAGAGAAVAAGLMKAVDNEAVIGKMNAQLGATGDLAKDLGTTAGNLYKSGLGESMQDAADAVKAVWQGGLIDEDATNAEIEKVSGKVMTLANVFDQDLGGVTAAVSTMIKTGLAPNAEAAMDILTRGFQQGADKGQDLLDTFTEYPVQFQALGLSGTEAMGLVSQGLQGGARNADLVADGIKEATLQLQGMGPATASAVKLLGLDASKMQRDITAGGKTAHDAFGLLLTKLQQIHDPVQKNQIAVGLFGTKAEDLQASLNGLDLSGAAGAIGNVAGALDKAGAAAQDNASVKIEKFKRQVSATFVNVLGSQVLPKLEAFGAFIERNKGPLTAVAAVIGTLLLPALIRMGVTATVSGAQTVAAFVATNAAAIGSVATAVASLIAQGARWVWVGITALASAAQVAAAWLISIGPIAIVIAAVAGLVFLIFKYWDDIKAATIAVWDFLWGKITGIVSAVVGWIQANWPLLLSILTGPIGAAVIQIATHWQQIKDGGVALLNWFIGLPGSLGNALSGLGGIILSPFKAAFNAVASAWNNSVAKVGFTVPGWVPKLGGKGWHIPSIPMLATGGLFTSPGMALVGEKGPELIFGRPGAGVAPLPDGGLFPPASGGGGTVVNVVINNAGSVVSQRELVDQVRTGIRDALRRQGRADIVI